jgi:CheY-like chemotaxis protein
MSDFAEASLRAAATRGPRAARPSRSRRDARNPGRDLEAVKILVVDDDPASAKLLSVVLRAEGCETRVAGSAEEALEILPSFRPRVMILDVILPLMSGLLLAQRLKADPETRDIVLIAVSAFNGCEAVRAAHAAGCAAYMPKPIDPLTFATLVATHLGDGK